MCSSFLLQCNTLFKILYLILAGILKFTSVSSFVVGQSVKSLGYRLDSQIIVVRSWKGEFFFTFASSSGACLPSYMERIGGYSPGVKWLVCEDDHWPTSSARG
jgi:hypothetical protein